MISAKAHSGELSAKHCIAPWQRPAYRKSQHSESETAKAYAGKALKLVPETPENIGWLLSKSMYPAPLAPHFFDDSAQHRLYDERRRIQQWMRLTHGVKGVCWLVAPWMPTDAEKGDLYKQFVP